MSSRSGWVYANGREPEIVSDITQRRIAEWLMMEDISAMQVLIHQRRVAIFALGVELERDVLCEE